MVFPRETLHDFLQHELRWSIGLRNVRKAGYLGLALTYGLPWTVLAAIAAPTEKVALAYVMAYFVLRLTMAWTVGVWGLGDPVTRRRIWPVSYTHLDVYKRQPEDHNIPAIDRLKAIYKLVDENPLLIAQQRGHARAFHLHGLIQENDDHQRKPERHRQIPRPTAQFSPQLGIRRRIGRLSLIHI